MIDYTSGEVDSETIAFATRGGRFILAIGHDGRAYVSDGKGDPVETDDLAKIGAALLHFIIEDPENVRALVRFVGESLALNRTIRVKVAERNRREGLN